MKNLIIFHSNRLLMNYMQFTQIFRRVQKVHARRKKNFICMKEIEKQDADTVAKMTFMQRVLRTQQ